MKSLFWTLSFFLQLLIDILAIDVATHIPQDITDRLPEAIKLYNETRRIMSGSAVQDNRPYMVHLKLPNSNEKAHNYRQWLCGGVIVHEDYILTSAACIEDVQHFYVVSGTYKYNDADDRYNNLCIKNGAKKAVWKCIPKNYVFDGHENDNIRWMNNDIAVVKVDEGFDFTRRVRGCEFIPKPVCYNNQSLSLEAPGTMCTIAGWGSTEKYSDWVNRRSGGRRSDNQQCLLEADVEIISKDRCKNRWGSRYNNIIENYMICSKDIGQSMSEICNEKYVECEDINYYDEKDGRRVLEKVEKVPVNMMMHSAYHNETYPNGTRRLRFQGGDSTHGGFCENDHGGPLVYGSGVNSVVIGIISACLVKERTNKCYGPFLYTSVYKNRQFISCSLYKDIEPKCRRQFRSGVTHVETVLSWKDHPDGPANFETPKTTTVQGNVQPNVETNALPTAEPKLEPKEPDADVKEPNLEPKEPSGEPKEPSVKPKEPSLKPKKLKVKPPADPAKVHMKKDDEVKLKAEAVSLVKEQAPSTDADRVDPNGGFVMRADAKHKSHASNRTHAAPAASA